MADKSTAVQTARSSTALRVVEPRTLIDRINRVYEAVSGRAFELFEGNGGIFGREWDDWFKAEAELLHPVHIHIDETNTAFSIRAEVPGFSTKELEVSIEPQRLVISGKRESKGEEKKGQTICCECRSNEILRVIELPAEVNTSGVTATLNNGVLELELPKAAKKQPVRIEPKAA
jgi:HSP20 family protein